MFEDQVVLYIVYNAVGAGYVEAQTIVRLLLLSNVMKDAYLAQEDFCHDILFY